MEIHRDGLFEIVETDMFKITGYDVNGVPRVYAQDNYFQTAMAFCKEEAAAYIKRRPDTGPLVDWRLRDDRGDEYEICG